MCKKDDRSPDKKSRFFATKGVGISFNIWPSKVVLKCLLQNICLLLDLLYHKCKSFITIAVDGTISFKKI